MGIELNKSSETQNVLENDICAIQGEQLSKHEFSTILKETIPPEVELIISYRQNVLGEIQKADTARSIFQAKKQVMVQNKTYKKTEIDLKATITEQFTNMVELKTRFGDYCSQKITQINNEYWFIKSILDKTDDPIKKIELKKMCNALSQAEDLYKELKIEGMSAYSDATMLLRNKVDTRRHFLMQNDPYKRSDDDDIKKAKNLVENGSPRSPANYLKYLGGGPITEEDRGKCGITDHTIDNNNRIITDLQTRAFARSKKKTEILRRDPKDPTIEIPDMSADLIAADEYVQNIMVDLMAKKIDVTRLMKSQS